MMYMIAYYIRPTATRTPNDVRSDLEEEIVKFGNWWHYFGDFWVVDTERSVNEMTEILRGHMSAKDDLLIAGIQPPYQGWLPPTAWKWLNETSRKHSETKEVAKAG